VRVLFVEQYPRFGGGSERMSLSLCKHAVARGHHVRLVHAEDGDMVPAYAAGGAACERAPVRPMAVRETSAAFTSAATLSRIVLRDRTDVVFTSQVNYVSLLALVGRLTRVRTAVHLGLTYDYPSPLFRAGIRSISVGVAPSEPTAAGWRTRGWPSGSLRVIPNGVDTSVFRPGEGRCAARRSLGIPEGQGLVVAYVGRLVPEKGIFTLLRAFAAHRRRGGEGRLVFVGAAPAGEVAQLEDAAAAEALDRCFWEVRPPTANPELVYRAADLVVVPSQWDEPFGLVPLEAIACGTMTIVSDRGRLPDFVAPIGGDAVFRSGDVEALRACLSRWLAADGARDRSAAALRDDVCERFGFERCGDAYLEVFQTLLS
jgi:glycosyltransferase involved in cell wall biosynthesis